MTLGRDQIERRYARLTAVAGGHLPPSLDEVDAWWAGHAVKLASAPVERHPAVLALGELIEGDGIVRMYVEEMIDEGIELWRQHGSEPPEPIDDTEGMLSLLDRIVETAPAYVPPHEGKPGKQHQFPMSNLFVYMMMTTAGEAAFRLGTFNDALRAVLKEWCAYLDSPDSAGVLNEGEDGWLSAPAYEFNRLGEFEIPDRSKPHWGWLSYNDFFHREIKASARPIAEPENPKAIASPNDGFVFAIARGVAPSERFWLKNQPYSLVNVLNGDVEYIERFAGGDVFQSFLSGANYHRWHSPIDGVVRKVELVEGLMFSDLEAAGYDPNAGTLSLGYEASVNTRGLVYVESPHPTIGTVCVIPIGITEISSVTFSVEEGQAVAKGDELGRFSYGGSTLAVVFQPGVIDHFTVSPPTPDEPEPPIQVNAQIAVAR